MYNRDAIARGDNADCEGAPVEIDLSHIISQSARLAAQWPSWTRISPVRTRASSQWTTRTASVCFVLAARASFEIDRVLVSAVEDESECQDVMAAVRAHLARAAASLR